MMALQDLVDAYLNKNDVFTRQVAGACLSAARDIENEDAETTNHTNRMVWVGQVLDNPLVKAKELLRDVTANVTVAAALPTAVDGDVQFVVNGLINTYATGE